MGLPALRELGALSLSAVVLALGACSTPAQPERMTIESAPAAAVVAPGRPGHHALSVAAVTGGSTTDPLWLSAISDADLKTALEASLDRVGMLSPSPAEAAYVVKAEIVDLQRPGGSLDPVLVFAPLDWDVTVKVRYTVTPSAGGPPVFDDLVAATGTAAGDSAATSDGRIRMGVEAAVRADIADFIERVQPSLK